MNKKELLLSASAWSPRPNRHYTFEPNTVNGNVLTDLSGTQNGVIVGSPAFITGNRGNCVKFDGNVSNNINIGNVDFMHQTGIFSMSFWAKTQYTDSGALLAICGNAISSTEFGFYVAFDDRASASRNRSLRLGLFDKSGASGGPVVDLNVNDVLPIDGEYHHYAITYDNKTAYSYIDGSQVGMISGKRSLNNSSSGLSALIGALRSAGSAAFPYNGEIDEFRIIPKTLTLQQVKRLYQTGQ